MPVTGRPPKDNAVNRNKKVHGWTEVEDVPYQDAPDLDLRVCEETSRWWLAVTSMPHCVLWRPSDWQFARDTARIHHEVFGRDDMARAAELRQREKIMGTTIDHLRALRIRYVDVEPEQSGTVPDNVTSMDERRARLTQNAS